MNDDLNNLLSEVEEEEPTPVTPETILLDKIETHVAWLRARFVDQLEISTDFLQVAADYLEDAQSNIQQDIDFNEEEQ